MPTAYHSSLTRIPSERKRALDDSVKQIHGADRVLRRIAASG
jgi:hypothetical protein